MFFKSTAEIKEHLPVSISFDYKDIKPDIRRAEQKFIRPILGSLYSTIRQKMADESQLSPEESEIVEICRPAIANLAYWFYVPKGTVRVTSSGIDVTVTDNRRNAPEWAVRNLKNSFRDTGFEELENLLEYLEDTTPTGWDMEPVKKYFINSAHEFNQHISPGISRFTFMQITAEIQRIEKRVKAITCKDLFDQLKSEIADGDISEKNEPLLELISQAVAHLSWASAMINLPVLVDQDGVHVFNSSFGGTIEGKQPAEQPRLAAITEKHNQIGETALGELQTFLQKNADEYPLFKESECYVEEVGRSPKNDKDSGIYFL